MVIDAANTATLTRYMTPPSQDRQDIASFQNGLADHGKSSNEAYDFTRMSRREFYDVWREEQPGAHFPLILPSDGLDLTKDTKTQMESAYDQKINFLEHFEQRVTYQKTASASGADQSTLNHYENTLSTIMSLQERPKAPSVDVLA